MVQLREAGPPKLWRKAGPPKLWREAGPPKLLREAGPPKLWREAGPPKLWREAGPPDLHVVCVESEAAQGAVDPGQVVEQQLVAPFGHLEVRGCKIFGQ